jgi:hypothetical protein
MMEGRIPPHSTNYLYQSIPETLTLSLLGTFLKFEFWEDKRSFYFFYLSGSGFPRYIWPAFQVSQWYKQKKDEFLQLVASLQANLSPKKEIESNNLPSFFLPSPNNSALRQTRVKYIVDLGTLAKTNPISAITCSITMFSYAIYQRIGSAPINNNNGLEERFCDMDDQLHRLLELFVFDLF